MRDDDGPQKSRDLIASTGSHPAIRFEQVPIAQGKLAGFNGIRQTVLKDVVERTRQEFENASPEVLLGEALYAERMRMKRERTNLFTKARRKRDSALWNSIQSGLVKSSVEADRKQLLQRVLEHYGEEIGGHFDPRVYWLATRAVPWGFSWLLNAASVQRFLPWGMTESLASRLNILGEVTHLQKLAQKGTVLLVPTHQSNIDSVLIGYIIYLMRLPPFAYGAGLNLFSNPALSFFMGNLGAYTVDRQKSSNLYKTLLKNYSTRILREGVHSIFFPGGGRSRSGGIESKLKLGLLGTGLEAQLENLKAGKPHPNVYVVPMVMSYHFVLEASSLIEDHLAEAGKHRYIIMDDESWQPKQVLKFFWNLFSANSDMCVRIGRPMDVFGNFVDDEGRSIGPNGTTIDPARWLSSQGELVHDAQRDREYTRELGVRIGERFRAENTVISSHLAAFAFFETLKKQYPDLDLYRFLRISLPQRSLPYGAFLEKAERFHHVVREAADRGQLFMTESLRNADTKTWFEDGLKNLGQFHSNAVLTVDGEGDGASIHTEDMNLLYYYRNRLAGYGFEKKAL